MAQHRLHLRLVDVIEDGDDAVALLDDEIEVGVEGLGAAVGGDVCHRATEQRPVGRAQHHDTLEATVLEQP